MVNANQALDGAFCFTGHGQASVRRKSSRGVDPGVDPFLDVRSGEACCPTCQFFYDCRAAALG